MPGCNTRTHTHTFTPIYLFLPRVNGLQSNQRLIYAELNTINRQFTATVHGACVYERRRAS